jgi:hypothetical protein
MPPEMSQVNVPALTRSACAIVATGDATVAATARAARTLNGLCISKLLSQFMMAYQRDWN